MTLIPGLPGERLARLEFERALCFKQQRTMAQDNTITFEGDGLTDPQDWMQQAIVIGWQDSLGYMGSDGAADVVTNKNGMRTLSPRVRPTRRRRYA